LGRFLHRGDGGIVHGARAAITPPAYGGGNLSGLWWNDDAHRQILREPADWGTPRRGS